MKENTSLVSSISKPANSYHEKLALPAVDESKHELKSQRFDQFLNLLMQSIKKKDNNPSELLDDILGQIKKFYKGEKEGGGYPRYEPALINLKILVALLNNKENHIFKFEHKKGLMIIAMELLRTIDSECCDQDIRNDLSKIASDLKLHLKNEFPEISKLEEKLPHKLTGQIAYPERNKGNWNPADIKKYWMQSRDYIKTCFANYNHLIESQLKFNIIIKEKAGSRFLNLALDYLIPLIRQKKPHDLEGLREAINYLILTTYEQNNDLTSCIHRLLFVCQMIHPLDTSEFKKTLQSQKDYQNWLIQQLDLQKELNLSKIISTLQLINAFIEAGRSEFTLLLLAFVHAINEYTSDCYKKTTISASPTIISSLNSVILQDLSLHLEKTRSSFKTSIEMAGEEIGNWKSLITYSMSNLPKVSHITSQEQATEATLVLLNIILQSCQNLLGDAPCEIALLALGSTSHQNRLPYSDLEFAFLCDAYPADHVVELNQNEKQIVAYVQTLCSLLDLSILCLGETFDELSNRGGFRIDTSTHFLFEEKANWKLIGTPEQLVANRIKKLMRSDDSNSKAPDDEQEQEKDCALIEDASLYSLLEPALVNTKERGAGRHQTGEKLFERYQKAVQKILENTVADAIKNQLEKKFILLPAKKNPSQDNDHEIKDVKETESLAPTKPIEIPGLPTLTYRQAIALYSLLEILQKSEKAIQEVLNGTLAEIDIKQIYGKPLTYFGLTLNLMANLGCSHPVAAILKASQDPYKLLTPGFAHFLHRCFEWVLSLRTQLHLKAGVQEECIKLKKENISDGIQDPIKQESDKNSITVDELNQGYFHIIVQNMIKPLRECLENYLYGRTKDSDFPFDSGYLLLCQLKNQSENPNPNFALPFIIRLAQQVVLQSQTVKEHLWFYHQIPTIYRNKYANYIIACLGNQPYEQVMIERLSHYPNEGLRRNSKRTKNRIHWEHFIKSEFTEEISKENFDKTLPELYTQKKAYIEWWDSQGRLQRGALPLEIRNQLFHANGTLCEEKRNPEEAQRLVIGITLKESQKNISNINDHESKDHSTETPVAFFKFFPEKAGVQIQTAELSQQISGYGLECIVAKLRCPHPPKSTNSEEDKWISYPVLISKYAGKTIAQTAEEDKTANKIPLINFENEESIDSYSFTLKFLESVIAGYEDERSHNLCLQTVLNSQGKKLSYRFISIDSDHAFQNALRVEGLFKNTVLNIKNFLYCFDSMNQPLDQEAVTEFLELDVNKVLKCMIDVACGYDRNYISEKGIFNNAEVMDYAQGLGKDQNKKNKCLLAADFPGDTITHLYLNIKCLQFLLKDYARNFKSKNLPCPLQVLKEIEPNLASYYSRLLEIPFRERMVLIFYPNDPERIKQISNGKPELKKSSQSSLVQEVALALSRPSVIPPGVIQMLLDAKHQAWKNELLKANDYYKDYDFIENYKKTIEEAKEEKDLEDFFKFCEKNCVSLLIQKIINRVDFSKITRNINDQKKSLQLQEKILKNISTHHFTKLWLVSCLALTDVILKRIIEKSPYLRILNLSGCKQINDDNISKMIVLLQQLKALEKLYLTNIATISKLGDIKKPPKLLALKQLILDGCVNLTSIELDMPFLEYMSASGVEGAVKYFMVNKLAFNFKWQERLFSYIHNTKFTKTDAAAQKAGEALTLLNAAHITFFGRDWSDTRIFNADMSYSISEHCIFTDAYLFHVNFHGAWICGTKFENIHAEKVIWEAQQQRDISKYVSISCMVIDHQGKWFVSGNNDATLHIRELDSGRIKKIATRHQSEVTCLTFSPNGKYLVSGDQDHMILVWSVPENITEFRCLSLLRGHTRTITCLAFNTKSDMLASGGKDGVVNIWEKPFHHDIADSGSIIEQNRSDISLNLFLGSITDIKFGHTEQTNKYLLSASVGRDPHPIRLWDLREIKQAQVDNSPHVALDHNGIPLTFGSKTHFFGFKSEHADYRDRKVAFDPTDQFVTSTYTNKLWNHNGENKEIKDMIECISFNEDINEPMCAIANRNRLMLWWYASNPEHQEELILRAISTIKIISFSPSNKLLALGWLDGTFSLLEIATRKILKEFKGFHNTVNELIWSKTNNETFLVVGETNIRRSKNNDSKIYCWKIFEEKDNVDMQLCWSTHGSPGFNAQAALFKNTQGISLEQAKKLKEAGANIDMILEENISIGSP